MKNYCPQGFSGPKCEFSIGDGENSVGTTTMDPKRGCSLQCENGRSLLFGDAPETSPYDDFDISSLNPNTGGHCRCPPWCTGFLCDNDIYICCDSNYNCENSGKCVQYGDGYKCECDTAHAGLNCENPATSFFMGPGTSKDFFCTNQGVSWD